MAKSKSSIVSVHYTSQIEALTGDLVEGVCHPDSFDIEVDSGKHAYSIKNLRFSLPDIQGVEVEDRFELENIYNQTIYTLIPGISGFSTVKIAINGRPVNEAETILLDQDILVLRRDIKVTAPKLKADAPVSAEKLDAELTENTNSVWGNEAIDAIQLFAKDNNEGQITVYDTFGNIKPEDHLVTGEGFITHIKRVNKLENVEFYKVYEDRYVHVEDVVTEDALGASTDPELQKILNQQSDTEESRNNPVFQDNFEEVKPFKVKFKNEDHPLFYNLRGEELDYAQPEVGATFTITGILHGIVDFYQIELDKFVLESDVEAVKGKKPAPKVDPVPLFSSVEEPIIDDHPDSVSEPTTDVDSMFDELESENVSESVTDTLTSLEITSESELILGKDEDQVYDYNEEMAKTDAFAVKNAFMDNNREDIEDINGIVQVKGEEDAKVNIFNSYKQDRELVPEKVLGGTFWYTNEAGSDEEGNRYYKIAIDTWIAEEDVKYFDK